MPAVEISTAENARCLFIAAEYTQTTITPAAENPKERCYIARPFYARVDGILFNTPLAAALYLAHTVGFAPVLAAAADTALLAAQLGAQSTPDKCFLDSLDSSLVARTFLSAERISLSDAALFCALPATPDKTKHANLARWYTTCANQPEFAAAEDKMMEFAEKAAKKKPKNSFETLPPTKFVLDEWKRTYSNKDTRAEALPWFYKNIDWDAYSLWRIEYKYNKELARIFMTCNLITGLFHRMDFLRKYIFAVVAVFGEDNCSELSGYILVRGKDLPPELADVPDLESYSIARVDITNQTEKTLFEDYLAEDGIFAGCSKPYNQGKVFK